MKKLLTILLSLLISVSIFATDRGWFYFKGTVVPKTWSDPKYYFLCEAFDVRRIDRHYWVEYRDGWDDFHNYHKDDYYKTQDSYYCLKDYSKGEDYHKDAIVDYSILTKFLNKTFPGICATMRTYRETHDGVNYYVTELRFLSEFYKGDDRVSIYDLTIF